MSILEQKPLPLTSQTVTAFQRFTAGQRWEHALLILSGLVLAITGLPQKYRATDWSQQILATPERVQLFQQIHHIFAVILIVEVLYHMGRAIFLMSQRQQSGEMFPTTQDLRDAWQVLKYLLFLSNEKPRYGKYNFEQKITYWFIFFGIGIMVLTGLILWFPIAFTRVFPGGVVPAAKLAHSTEAIVAVVFVVIWHFYHVHVERLNLSMFTGWLSEKDMRTYHPLEHEHLAQQKSTNIQPEQSDQGGKE